VATSMLVILASAGFAVLTTGTRSAAKAKRYGAMVAHGQAALQIMARDLRAAVEHEEHRLVSLDTEYDGLPADTIDFVVPGMPKLDRYDPEASGRCEVGYYIENDPDTEAQWLLRREDGSPDEDLLGGGAASLAGPYVAGLDLEFYDGLFWQSGWDEEEFPQAVSIQIVVVDKDETENPKVFRTTVPIMAH